MKKINKKDLKEFVFRAMSWKIYAHKYDFQDIAVEEINEKDERYKELFNSFFDEILDAYGVSVGNLSAQVIGYSIDNGLNIENVVNALRALEIEVEE